MKELEPIKKQSLLTLELSSDTKTNITSAELTKFVQNVKRLLTKKNIVLVAFEKLE